MNLNIVKIVFILFLIFTSCTEAINFKEEGQQNAIVSKNTKELGLEPKYIYGKDYSDVKFLGRGAFGSVFSAKFNTSNYKNQSLAVKINRDWGAYSEYNIQKEISHPFIPRVYEVVNGNIIMEHIQEARQVRDKKIENYLFEILKNKDEKYQVQFFLDKLEQLLEVLKYLHEKKNIAHLDIAEHNILIKNLNEKDTLYLIDFGKSTSSPTKAEKNKDVFDAFRSMLYPFKHEGEFLFKDNERFLVVLELMAYVFRHKMIYEDKDFWAYEYSRRYEVPSEYVLIDIDPLLKDISLLKEEFLEGKELSFKKYSLYKEAEKLYRINNEDFSKYEEYE